MSAINTSARLPNSAVGQIALEPSWNIGASSGIEASISALPSASSSRASLPSCEGGTPMYSSSPTPSGPLTRSSRTSEMRLPVARRTTSPTM